MKSVLLVFITVLYCAPVHGSDCRIIETADKVEVVCEGVPEVKKPEPKAAPVVNTIMSERRIEQALVEEKANAARLAEQVKDKKKELDDLNDWYRNEKEKYQKSIGK